MLFPIKSPYFSRVGTSWNLLDNRDLSGDQLGYSVAVSGNYSLVGANLDDNKGDSSGSVYVFERNGTSGIWLQTTKLTAGDGQPSDQFGCSVAVSGSYAIVGAYLDDDKGADAGAVYIFERNATTWIQKIKLTASDGVAGDYFGYSVAISGNYAIVGAYQDDDGGTSSGSAYIFERNTTTGVWSQTAKLIANDDAAGDQFGRSVAISGNYAIIGSPYDDDKGTNSGSAYIFERNTTTGVWAQAAKFTASDGAASDLFGFSVAVSGNYAIVGAFADDTSKGSAYVFERNTTTGVWAQAVKLTASDGAASDEFGRAVAISGNYAVVGSWLDDDGGTNSGSAYVFERNTTTGVWAQTTKLVASDDFTVDHFGAAVAISGTYVMSGAPLNDEKATDAGAAYAFERNATSGVWEQAEKLIPFNDEIADQFGQAVAMYDNRVIVAAPFDDVRGKDTGSVSFYERNTTSGVWELKNKFTGTDSGTGDYFGCSVAMAQNYAIVGAYGNDDATVSIGAVFTFVRNATTGVWTQYGKISPSDVDTVGSIQFGYSVGISGTYAIVGANLDFTKGTDAGAVYILERNSTNGTWPDVIKITASDGAAGDQFGYSSAMSGTYAIAGAPFDDTNRGSAYVIERNATTGIWAQVAKLTASDRAVDDYFGQSVAIDGNYAIVGAYRNANSSIRTGSAYIFERNTTTGVWTQKAKIVASDRAVDDYFGWSVSVSGNLVVVSSFSDTAGVNVGASYVFERNVTTGVWTQKTKIVPSDSQVNGYFGQSVAIYGTYAIVGAYGRDVGGSNSGSAYVFEQNTTTGVWSEAIELYGGVDGYTFFGTVIGISGNYALVAAKNDNDRGKVSGSVYVFEYNALADAWSQTSKLTPDDGSQGDLFGIDMAVSGNYAIIGSYGDDDAGASSGSAYVFERDTTLNVWIQKAKLVASDATAYDNFGRSVGISGNYAMVGANGDDDVAVSSGAVYFYERNATTGVWTQKQKLVPSDAVDQTQLGWSSAVSGNYAISGAYLDQGNGAAYVFERNTTTGVWSQKAKLLPSDNSVSNDQFGFSVSISGNYAVVGSQFNNERALSAGAAYVYQRNTTTGVWSQVEKLMASDGAAYDYFGKSVSISGNYIIVGANCDDVGAGNTGSAYIYERNPATNAWTQIAKINASDYAAGDQFGYTVCTDGTYFAVGATYKTDVNTGELQMGEFYINKLK